MHSYGTSIEGHNFENSFCFLMYASISGDGIDMVNYTTTEHGVRVAIQNNGIVKIQ